MKMLKQVLLFLYLRSASSALSIHLCIFNNISSHSVSKAKFGATDNCRASSRYHPFVEMQQPVDGVMMDNLLGAPAPNTSMNNLGKIILSSDF
jgi:hypothetical protein